MYDIYAARRMLKSRAHTPKRKPNIILIFVNYFNFNHCCLIAGVAGVTSWGEGRDFYGAVCPQDVCYSQYKRCFLK